MADLKQLSVIQKGATAWKQWRFQNRGVRLNLSQADLSNRDLRNADFSDTFLGGVNFSGSDLSGVNFDNANLMQADLLNANLKNAELFKADLWAANLTQANLTAAKLIEARLVAAQLDHADLTDAVLPGADFRSAKLTNTRFLRAKLDETYFDETDLTGADLTDADLRKSHFIKTNLTNTKLNGCNVYGIAAWDLETNGTSQLNLLITEANQPAITLDNLEMAQFIYMMLNNSKLRDVIDTVTSKTVLILGRFYPARKAVLDAIRDELRNRNYVPVMFDFDKPNQTFTETVTLLARMSRFVIADLTDPSSIPQELQAIIPNVPTVPVQPIIEQGYRAFSMFPDHRVYRAVLETYEYQDLQQVLTDLSSKIIDPAEQKWKELKGFI